MGVLFASLLPQNLLAEFSHELGVRVRYEAVDFYGDSGNALTAKFRLSGQHQTEHWQVLGEVDYVASALRSNHSDAVVFNGEPVIADPRGFDLNQLLLRYQGTRTQVTLGRQSLAFDDQRFLGDLAFRQNGQSYDALQVRHSFLTGVNVEYAYISQVNRIFGRQAERDLSRSDIRFANLAGRRPTSQLGEHDVDAHVIRFNAQVHDYVELLGEAQAVHNSDHGPFSNRTATLGANLNYKPGLIKWQSSLIFAKQQKQETAVDDWLSFSRIELSASRDNYQLSLRQERFGSTDGQAFVTPLATLHKFQGWADRFLNTPAAGLRDDSILLRWRKTPYTVDARYHDFRTVSGDQRLGTEFNLDLILKPSKQQEWSLRFADFQARDTATQIDVTKLFLTYSYNL